MTQGSLFIALQGGTDEISQAMTVPRGRVIGGANYQSALQGYQRIDGFERFDGRPGPTAVGQSLLDSGNLAGSRAARDAQRSLIQMVPGSGPVRGIARFNGTTYAWRDAVDGMRGVMYRATPTGWQAVPIGASFEFTSGGTYAIAVGNTITGATSGATALVRNVVILSGTLAAGDAAGYIVTDAATGTFVAENLNVGANANVATIAAGAANQRFPPGGRYFYKVRNFYGNPNTRALYGCNGVGRAFVFDGVSVTFVRTGLSADLDQPIRIAEHKAHLVLAFRGGSVQGSQTGEPLLWSGTFGAYEIAVGDEITDFIDNNVDSLSVICETSIHVITGSDSTDLNKATLNDEAGGIAFTAQKAGQAVYLDNSGVRSLTATPAYGNFKLGSLTLGVQRTFDRKKANSIKPRASLTTASGDLYRLFYEDGSGVSLYFGRKSPEPMLFDLGQVVSCICSAQDTDGIERAFFGSDNGYVYQLDVGTSFDGDEIESFIRMPFDNAGSPRLLKRFDKAIVETVPSPETKIGVVYEFDYGNTEQPGATMQTLAVRGGGGDWNTVDWNTFQWSAPIDGSAEFWLDGQGRNIALTLVCRSDEQRSHVLQGVSLLYRVKGQVR